ncbi:MAG: hypothetical protein JXR76_09830 [Deltaproteobacteria bacterium]|nr:hypothetical protein [Deltaproteobacteria bacterium]
MENQKAKTSQSAQSETDMGKPNPEVSDKPKRRTFSTKQKAKILEELDASSRKGEV